MQDTHICCKCSPSNTTPVSNFQYILQIKYYKYKFSTYTFRTLNMHLMSHEDIYKYTCSGSVQCRCSLAGQLVDNSSVPYCYSLYQLINRMSSDYSGQICVEACEHFHNAVFTRTALVRMKYSGIQTHTVCYTMDKKLIIIIVTTHCRGFKLAAI